MEFRRPARKKLSREKKAIATYQKLIEAAALVIGENGYAATTIAKITETAGVAQGTFYNYFEDRQQLFDKVLPQVGHHMIDDIISTVQDVENGSDREVARFRAYCEYLERNPGFYRILYEAEVFAPKAHQEHIEYISDGYYRALERSYESGRGIALTEEESKVVVAMLLGARAYVAMQFIKDEKIPEYAISAYAKLVKNGLFSEQK